LFSVVRRAPAASGALGVATAVGMPLRLVVAILSAALLFAGFAVEQPSRVDAASTMIAKCGVNLRTAQRVSARSRATIRTGARVTVIATVSGGAYRATCAGRTVSGGKWYRISAVNGRTVRSLYGVSYLYAATGLFRAAPAPTPAPTPTPTLPPAATWYTACPDVNVRAATTTAGELRARLPAGVPVGVTGTVAGGDWSAECGGQLLAGNQWYQITTINGQSVLSLYGMGSLYGASGLFSPTAPAPTPVPTPTPLPTPETTPVPLPTPVPTPSPYTEGIDVSHWQGTVDWFQVAAAGKRYAFIKASEDTDFVDSMYQTNRFGAKSAGLYVGAYHFARPERTPGDPEAEADNFIATAGWVSGELLPVLDLEVTGGLNQYELQAWTMAFLQRVYDRTGVRALIYTSPTFWRNNMGDTDWFALNGYRVLWIAHWTTAPAPSTPANNWGGLGWTFWQYTSNGAVAGIAGRVDLNRYNGFDLSPVLVPQSVVPLAEPVAPAPQPTPAP